MDDNTKQNFIAWLQDNNVKKLHPSTCIDCLEAVSDYAVKHSLSKVPFWGITDYKQFNAIKNSILSSRIFKFFNRSNAKNFDIAGKLYSDYLKENFAQTVAKPVTPVTVDTSTPVSIVSESIGQEINLAEIVKKSQPHEVVEGVPQPQAENNEQIEIVKPEIQQDGILTVDFTAPSDYTYTSIKSVSYFDKVRTDISSWKETYQFILREISEDYPDKINQILADNYCAGTRIELGEHSYSMRTSLYIKPDLFAESNHNAGEFVKKIAALLHFCNVDYENVVIQYVKDKKDTFKKSTSFITSVNELHTVNFGEQADYTFTTVKSVSYFGKECENVNSWRRGYEFLLQELYFDYPDKFFELLNDNNSAGAVVRISQEPSVMKAPIKIVAGIYTEGNRSAGQIINLIKTLLNFCNVDYDNVVIKYTNDKQEEPEQSISQPVIQVQQTLTGSQSCELNYNERLIDYKCWLSYVKKLNENTCNSYYSSLKTIDTYLTERNVITKSIVITESVQLLSAMDKIFANEGFLSYNSQQHNRFSAALKSFYEYRTGEQYFAKRLTQIYSKPDYEYENTPFYAPEDYDGILFNYKLWLAEVKNLNEHTCNSYCSSIKTIDEYLCKRQIIEHSIVSYNSGELPSVMDSIFADQEFIEYNKQQHNRFSAALKSFYQYKTGASYSQNQTIAQVIERIEPAETLQDVSKRQPVWDIYEAVILLNGYLKISNGEDRQKIIGEISKNLRQMAVNQGKVIDDAYRNFNGIGAQSYYMKVAFTGESNGLMPSKLFIEVVNLYKNDRATFNSFLNEAYKRCAVFQSQQVESQTEISVDDYLKIADFFCDSALSELFEKLFIYQKNTCGGIVLDVRQPIIGAKKEGEKLRFYIDKNKHIHFSQYIVDYLPYDKPFTADLFDEYCRVIEKNNIYFADNAQKVALKQQPVQAVKPAKVQVAKQTPVQSAEPSSSVQELPSCAPKVEKFILDADIDGTDYNEICNEFRLTMAVARSTVKFSSRIVEIKNKLYHEDAFCDWQEGADKLCSIMQKLMQRNNGYISSAQLYDYVSVEMHMFLNDNGINDERSVYELAQHLFEKNSYNGVKYSFSGKKHISAQGGSIANVYDLIRKFAEDHGGVFYESDLTDYMVSVGSSPSSLHQKMQLYDKPDFFFCEEGKFIYAKYMDIDDKWFDCVAEALKKLFDDLGDHIILSNINAFWFEKLPALPCGQKWNALLLQGVLRFYNKRLKARTIYAMWSQDMLTLHAMLVSAESPIQNFCDAVISYFYDNEIEKTEYEAEELRQLLLNAGMIHGGELWNNMHKALNEDSRFVWNAAGDRVTVRVE